MVAAGSVYSGSLLTSGTWTTARVKIARPLRAPGSEVADTPASPHRVARIDVVVRRKVQELSVEAHHEPVDRVTQPHRIRRDGIEHGLSVCRRAANDAQDLACCRLLLASQ